MSLSVDALIGRLAERRYGIVTAREILDAGVSRGSIDRRLADGRLVIRHRGVYEVAGGRHPLARFAAALVACGPGSALSHVSAGELYGFNDTVLATVHVTVTSGKPAHRGITVHRSRSLPVRSRKRLPLTTPIRTLHDLSRTLGDDALDRAVSEAHARRLVTPGQVRAEARGRLRRMATERPGFTRSEAERRLRVLLVQARLPLPEFNKVLHGFEVDVVWEDAKLVVEVDGWDSHSGQRIFHRDRTKTLVLQSHGFTVLHITWRHICDEPLFVASSIARAL